jgi:hypothetical protein
MENSKKNLNSIPFINILKKAWAITWKNKFLWWLGLFLTLINFNGNFSSGWEEKNWDQEKFLAFIQANSHWLIIAAFIILIIFIILLLFSSIARGGLITALDKIVKEEKTNFKESFRAGKKTFLKILGLNLIIFSSTLIILSIAIIPALYCFLSNKITAGILITIPAIIIVIISLILATYLRTFGQIYIVVGKLKIIAALENAYKIFLNNFWTSIIMGLFLIPISIVLGIAIFITLLIAGIIFIPLGLILWSLLKETGTIISIIIGLPIILFIILMLSSIFKVFHQTVWFLFFKEIASTHTPKEILEEITQEETALAKSPDPVSGITSSKID